MRLSDALYSSFVAVTAMIALTTPSHAAELTWQAPAGCPDRDAVRWRVEEALNSRLQSAAPLRFSAEVEKKSNRRWSVVISVSGPSEDSEPLRREIEAATCDDLAQAASVAIALALGAGEARQERSSGAVAAEGTTTDLEPAAPNAATSVALIRADVTPKAPMNRHEYRLSGQLGALFDYGSLPRLTPGVRISALGSWRLIGVKLSGFAFPESIERTGAGPGGSFSLWAGSVALCGLVPENANELQLCTGTELGLLRGKGLNATMARTGSSGWLAPFVELDASFGLTRSIRLFASAALVLPLIRKDFEILSQGVPQSVHQPGAVAARLGLGVEMLWQ